MDYAIGAAAFPPHAHYVALGHLHRTQQIAGAAPIWYSGSPLQVDFGEMEGPSNVLVVTADRKSPAVVRPIAVSGGRRLRTLRGTVDQLRARGRGPRRRVPPRLRRGAGEGRPRARTSASSWGTRVVEVRLGSPVDAAGGAGRSRIGQTPHELFTAYLENVNVEDPRLTALFAELLDEVT